MRLKKTDLIFLVVVVAVVGALAVLSLIRKHPPEVSLGVAEHSGLTAESKREQCLPCHAPESGGKVVYADLNIDKPPVVSLEGELVKLPDEVLAAHVAGDSEPHVMADTALMLRCMNGFALL